MTNLDRPEIEPMLEPAPKVLTTKDIVIGDGAEAQDNSVVNVHYLGVDYETGEEFDSSWGRGESIEFPLNRLIKGWQEGIPGMKVGGRRMLICPPEMAYGPVGGGHHLSGRTLVFVIDLLGFQE
jgi:peptidylprolyl isomerase